jgi:hypothetical protein
MFDYVDEQEVGKTIPVDAQKFFFSGSEEYSVVGIANQKSSDRTPLKLGLNLGPADLPMGAAITVVAHPKGGPREVSIGHVTFVDDTAVLYNAGAKAAVGSAVLFAHATHLHVIAMGLRSHKQTDEMMGVRVSVMAAQVVPEATKPAAKPAIPEGPGAGPGTPNPAAPKPADAPAIENAPALNLAPGETKVIQVENHTVKLPNGHSCKYTGDLKVPMELPHGVGTASYDHGVKYEGNWRNGKREGEGKIMNEEGGYYSVGECENDLFIGTWTKKSMKDDKVLEEQHYDHSTLDAWKRTLGFGARKAKKEDAPTPTKT